MANNDLKLTTKVEKVYRKVINHNYKPEELTSRKKFAKTMARVMVKHMRELNFTDDEFEHCDDTSYVFDMTLKKDKIYGRDLFVHLFPEVDTDEYDAKRDKFLNKVNDTLDKEFFGER